MNSVTGRQQGSVTVVQGGAICLYPRSHADHWVK